MVRDSNGDVQGKHLMSDINRMIFLRIEWMKRYEGLSNDPLLHPAGKYAELYGHGMECWNFDIYEGKHFGFVQHSSPMPIVKRLARNCYETEDSDRFEKAIVIWVATRNRSASETYIVGWWRNATIYSSYLQHPRKKEIEDEIRENDLRLIDTPTYCITCAESDSYLVPEKNRSFQIPRGSGWMAHQSLVWYADGGGEGNRQNHNNFKSNVLSYILGHTSIGVMEFSPELADNEYIEGSGKFVTHYIQERNQEVARRAKDHFRKKHGGRLFCQACKLDFSQKYGRIGDNFIEAHHILPLSYTESRSTQPKDFFMLCSNCHRMVHRLIAKLKRPVTESEVGQLIVSGYVDELLDREGI